ncbi:MAG: hypothetical protein AAGG68_07010 [Bacteroidota bacterium]
MQEYNKSFKYWKTQEVEEVFGIAPAKNKTRMEDWENVPQEYSEEERKELMSLQEHLIAKVKYWNEAALKFYFLGPLIRMVQYDTDRYNSFLEQNLKLKVSEEIEISGNIDFLVATGKQIPKTPFFTLHEYKPEPNISTDPQGQLLVAMIAAQQANKAIDIEQPLYGVYVTGRFWFFVVLDGNEYMESLAYDATQQDIFQIFSMLKKAKFYIEAQLDEKDACND